MKRTKARYMLMYLAVVALFGSLLGEQDNNQWNNVQGAQDNRGKLFVFAFLEMRKKGEGSSRIYVTSDDHGAVSLYTPYANLTEQKGVTPGTTVVFELPPSIRMEGLSTERKGILLSSNVSVSVYATSSSYNTRDVYMVYPVVALGNEYMVATFTPRDGSLVGVVGARDNTLVQIRLQTKGNVTYNGAHYKNGDVIQVFLNKLDVFQLKHTSDLTGTLVTSSQPVTALSGNICAGIPRGETTCSHLITQVPSLSKWGNEFITVPINARRCNGDVFRVVTAYNETLVNVIGTNRTENFSLNAGEFREFELKIDEICSVFSTKPCMLVQFNKGSCGRVHSEPFMVTVPPIIQYTTHYNLVIPLENNLDINFSNYVNIVIESSKIQNLVFDLVLFRSNFEWKTVPSTNYSIGSNSLKSSVKAGNTVSISHTSKDVRFGVFVFGHRDYDGYGYVGGMRMTEPNCCRLKVAPGDGMDNDCDGRVDEEKANGLDDDKDGKIDEDIGYISNECDFTSVLKKVTNTNNNCLKDVYFNYTVIFNSCQNIIKKVWYVKSNIGAQIQLIEQEFEWVKPKLNITFPANVYVDGHNISVLQYMKPNISAVCSVGDVNITYQDVRRKIMKEGMVITRIWTVREQCGRTVTGNQTIIEKTGDDKDNGGEKKAVSNIKIISGICFGVVLFFVVVAFFFYGRWKKHKARCIVVSVQRIDVLEANTVQWQYTNPTAIEDCVYAEISTETPNNKVQENGVKQMPKIIENGKVTAEEKPKKQTDKSIITQTSPCVFNVSGGDNIGYKS